MQYFQGEGNVKTRYIPKQPWLNPLQMLVPPQVESQVERIYFHSSKLASKRLFCSSQRAYYFMHVAQI